MPPAPVYFAGNPPICSTLNTVTLEEVDVARDVDAAMYRTRDDSSRSGRVFETDLVLR
jgi:hypothetical protein